MISFGSSLYLSVSLNYGKLCVDIKELTVQSRWNKKIFLKKARAILKSQKNM